MSLPGPVRRKVQLDRHDPGSDAIDRAAGEGLATPVTSLPYHEQIQASFGGHDIGHVKAHTGDGAAESAAAMGAEGFASGEHVVLGRAPTLHTVAHEVAHVMQSRSGVARKAGDSGWFERHADEVADRVVAGRSAADLLDGHGAAPAPVPAASAEVRRKLTLNAVPVPAATSIDGHAALAAEQLARLDQMITDPTQIFDFDDAPALKRHLADPSVDPPRVVSDVVQNKGGMSMIRTPSLRRVDSGDNEFNIPGTEIHDGLRDQNIEFYPDVEKKAKTDTGTGKGKKPKKERLSKDPEPNVVAAAVTFTYRVGAADYRQFSHTLPKGWNSGLMQKHGGEEHEHEIRDELGDFLYGDEFGAKAESDGAGLRTQPKGTKKYAFSKPPEKKGAAKGSKSRSKSGVNSTPFAHSETAAASDGEMVELMTGALTALNDHLGDLDAVLVNTALDVDSYPNTMCMNACRIAIKILRDRLEARLKIEFEGDGGGEGEGEEESKRKLRLSGRHQTDSRTSAARVFMPSHNPVHRDAHALPDGEGIQPPLILGAGRDFELLAGGRGPMAKPRGMGGGVDAPEPHAESKKKVADEDEMNDDEQLAEPEPEQEEEGEEESKAKAKPKGKSSMKGKGTKRGRSPKAAKQKSKVAKAAGPKKPSVRADSDDEAPGEEELNEEMAGEEQEE